MKKMYFFFAALFAAVMMLGFTSCNGNNPDSPLVGTWVYVNGDPAGMHLTTTLVFDGNFGFTFDETAYFDSETVHASKKIGGVYEIKDNIVTVNYQKVLSSYALDMSHFEPYTEVYKYEINGDTLKMDRQDIEHQGYLTFIKK